MTEGDVLLALARHDLSIARAEKTLDELPEKQSILKLRQRLKEIEGGLEKAHAYCRKAESMVARSQDEIASVDAKLESEQAKVLSGEVSNPKELQNLTRELDSLKKRKDTLEREALEVMEKAETGGAQVAKVEAALDEGRAKEADLIERFREHGGDIQRDIERLRAERALLIGRLPGSLAARYESLRVAKHGIAVGELKSGLCSACSTQLPAGEAQRLTAGPEIGECPNCRRLLIIRVEPGA